MALVKATLKANIESLLIDMRKKETISDSEFAEKLATAIDTYVKSMTVTVAGVVTAGSPTTQTQTVPVTATIT